MMESSQVKKSSNPKKIKDKTFKLPIEESIKIIEEVRKIQKHSKTIKPDQNRKQYQQLLEWVLAKLQASKQSVYSKKLHLDQQNIQIQNILDEVLQQEIQIQQRLTIQTLMKQMIEMFKRQCKQKSQLMQVCFSYFNQLINSYTKHYQNQLQETFKTYNTALTQIQDQYEDKLSDFQKKVSHLQNQKQTKWKNFYMLAKDNRILRRQKGKLLRTVQEQDQNIKALEDELCQITKENQMNKLIIRFQNDSENLKTFLKNRVAIMKFQKVLENYPKKAMIVLSNELLKLQIQQLNSLDSKIDYIKRVIIQSGDIFDQYQDLYQFVDKPNKMVFNMFSQTDPQDVEPPKQLQDASVNSEPFGKRLKLFKKIIDIKIINSPQLKQTFQILKKENLHVPSKLPSFNIEKNKKYVNLQLCPQVYSQTLKSRIKIHKQAFGSNSQKPKFKYKEKSFITENTKQDDQNFVSKKSILMEKMPQSELKKDLIKNRKSEILSSKNYAIKNPLLNKSKFGRLSQQKIDASAFLSFQHYPEESKNNFSVDEKSQISQIKQPVILEEEQKNIQEDQTKNHQILTKFKKSKRASRRVTQIIPLSFLNGQISNDPKSPTQIKKTNEVQKQQSFKINDQKTDKEILKESPLDNKKQKNKNTLKKVSRVKTSQNLRKSSSSNRLLTDMGFIQEQQSQNEPKIQSKSKGKNRFSYNQTLNLPRSFGLQGHQNNLNQFKENYTKQFLDGKKKYRISINPADFDGKSKLSRFTSRNSSLNPNIKKRQSQNNVDTCSMNSFFSGQNQQKINYKALMSQVKSKQAFLEGLQSQFLDPISIKPYEVKKIVEKILKSMYIRRKDLLSGSNSPCLKNYIEHFLKQLYGEKWKGQKNVLRYNFTVYDRDTSSDIRVFNLLMNTKVHIEYLQDLFRLYLTMIQKNDCSSTQNYLTCNKSKASSILKYLLSIYFDQETSNEVTQNLPILNNFQVDLNEIFIVVQTQLRRFTMQTQIYYFLCNLIPQNQSNIQFSQMKEILFVFKNEANYHIHISRLKYFFKIHGKTLANQQKNLQNKVQNQKNKRTSKIQKTTNLKKTLSKEQTKLQIQILPFHRVCLYLKRYQWKNLLQINTFVQNKYRSIIGVFIQQEAINFISQYCLKISEKFHRNKTNLQGGIFNIPSQVMQNQLRGKNHPLQWLLERSKQIIRNHYRYKSSIDRHLLMYVHLSIIIYELQISMQEVVSQPLNLLSLEFKRIKTKQQVDIFLKE